MVLGYDNCHKSEIFSDNTMLCCCTMDWDPDVDSFLTNCCVIFEGYHVEEMNQMLHWLNWS